MTIKEFQERIVAFRNARNWKQFHHPKDLAIALNLEASEVLEHFLWKSEEEIAEYIKTNKNDIGEELADTFYWILLMAHDLGIDLEDAFVKKQAINEKKYPVEKAKGKHTKYTELEK